MYPTRLLRRIIHYIWECFRESGEMQIQLTSYKKDELHVEESADDLRVTVRYLTLQPTGEGMKLLEFWKVARSGFEAEGRGALIIDMVAMAIGTGHQFEYVKQEQIRQLGAKDEIRMVGAYDPSWELVIILLKPQDRMSSYRVGIPEHRAKRTRR